MAISLQCSAHKKSSASAQSTDIDRSLAQTLDFAPIEIPVPPTNQATFKRNSNGVNYFQGNNDNINYHVCRQILRSEIDPILPKYASKWAILVESLDGETLYHYNLASYRVT